MIISANMNVDLDIKRSLNRMGISNDGISAYPAYLHTNENPVVFMDKLNISNQNILSVAASGEHLLCMAPKKPKRIDAFDLNSLSYYFMCLRIASKVMLNKEEEKEFLPSFFNNLKHTNAFDYKYYIKLRSFLPEDALYFWDNIYNIINKNDINCSRICGLIRFENECMETFNYLNDYGKEIKDSIIDIDITFKNVDFLTNCYKTFKSQKYGTIYLSNIYDWCKLANDSADELTFQKMLYIYLVKRKFPKLLVDDGTMLVYYDMYNRLLNKTPFDKIEGYDFDSTVGHYQSKYALERLNLEKHTARILKRKNTEIKK